MAIYYVDLDLASNPGYLENDPLQPMGWAEFQPFHDPSGGGILHEMRIKGSRDAAAENKLIDRLRLKAWDLTLYGPWRLRIQEIGNFVGTLSNDNCEIHDGIIEAHNLRHLAGTLSTSLIINNCFIRSNYFSFQSNLAAPMTITIQGSTIRINTNVQGFDPTIIIQDSVIDWPNSKTITSSSTFTNSVFNRPNDWSGISSIVDCQFNWTPPSWPTWDASQSSWSSSIASGIDTPPQPGNAPYTGYETGLFGNPRSGIGAFYFTVNKLFLTQRTNRHIAKCLIYPDSEDAYYAYHFGTYGVSGGTTSLLNSPWDIKVHSSGNFFVCDHNNERIVKLDGNLNYVDEYSTSSTIGKPCAMLIETDIYVAGINYHIINGNVLYMYINIEKLDVNFASLKFTNDVLGVYQRLEQRKGEITFKPISLIRGYDTDEILIAGIRKKIYSTIEQVSGFSILTEKPFYEERPIRIIGMIRHSNGFVYLNLGTKIHKFDSTFTNVGDSDFIGKTIYGLSERLNGNLLIYKVDNQSIVEYDDDLNFVKEVMIDSGDTVQTDLYDVMGIVEASY